MSGTPCVPLTSDAPEACKARYPLRACPARDPRLAHSFYKQRSKNAGIKRILSAARGLDTRMNVQRGPCCTFILFPAPTQGRRTLESRQRFSDTPRMNVQLRPSRLLDLKIRWSSTPGRGHLTAGQGPGRSGGAWSEGGARAAAAASPHPTARAPRQPLTSAVRPQPGPDDTCAPAGPRRHSLAPPGRRPRSVPSSYGKDD